VKKFFILFGLVSFLVFLATASANLMGDDPINLHAGGKTGVQSFLGNPSVATFSLTNYPSGWSPTTYTENYEISGLKSTRRQLAHLDGIALDEDPVFNFEMVNAKDKPKKRGKIIFDFGDGVWRMKEVDDWRGVFPYGYAEAADFSMYASAFSVGGEIPFGGEQGGPSASLLPEPATILLLGAGLIGLAGYSNRKFKTNQLKLLLQNKKQH